jgi:hypothetical protein
MNQEGLNSHSMDRIVKARITTLPKQLGDPLPEVWVTLPDGTEKMLFTYYPDEISFSESDFVGLSEEEAGLLKFGRDRAYLQS